MTLLVRAQWWCVITKEKCRSITKEQSFTIAGFVIVKEDAVVVWTYRCKGSSGFPIAKDDAARAAALGLAQHHFGKIINGVYH